MRQENVRVKILRFKPGAVDPPRYQTFELSLAPGATVLDALEAIRNRHDPSLLYRHSCHHASCGTCACKVNGTERLACITPVHEFKGSEIVLEPLDGFPCEGDLVVDVRGFHKEIPQGLSYHRPSELNSGTALPEGVAQYTRFESCIECGACVSACPAYNADGDFMGPATLAAVHREVVKKPDQSSALLELAGSERGVERCERALNCSRVCPSEVYPARHIHDLQKALRRNG